MTTRADRYNIHTAFHEAGHAVAAFVILGAGRVQSVELDPANQGLAGVVRVNACGGMEIGWHCLAGPAAGQILNELRGWSFPESQDDMRKARAAFGGRLERWRLPHIREWLRTSEIWPWVELVANELLAQRHMTGEELEALLEPMDWPAKPAGMLRDFAAQVERAVA